MATAGYSGTPLPTKLGIKELHVVGVVNAPPTFAETLGTLPTGARVITGVDDKRDVVIAFVTSRAALAANLAAWRIAIEPAGGLWIAWPKKSSGVVTDMTEDVVREVALPTGLVDNKVCAIDDTWSGLRLVVRLEHRGTTTKPKPKAKPAKAKKRNRRRS
jgi:hypothetical protein